VEPITIQNKSNDGKISVENKTVKMNIILATSGFQEQEKIIEKEDNLAFDLKYLEVDGKITDTIKAYLLMTSLPFVINSEPKIDLEDVWVEKSSCNKCRTVVDKKYAMSSGNLNPKYFVVGDAPSDASLDKYSKFNRAWDIGPSSKMLRLAFNGVGIYRSTWFANLLGCAVTNNRDSYQREIKNCKEFLKQEIKQAAPENIILLGNHVANNFPFEKQDFNFEFSKCKVYHPAYFLYRGRNYKDYSDYLRNKLEVSEGGGSSE